MSHGGRAFQTHAYSAISPDALRAHRQSMLNQQQQQYVQQQQQAVMTSVSTPSTTSAYSSNHHHVAAAAVAVAAAGSGGGPGGNNPTTTATPSNHHTSPINSHQHQQHQQQHQQQQQQQQQRTRPPPPLDTMYCDNCQVLRHVTYFTDDRGIKYNVCILCRGPTQLQKRKQIYEEQERALKHARYSQYQQQQQQQQHHQSQPPPQQQPPSHHHQQQQQQQHQHQHQQQQQQQLASRFLHTPPTGGSPSSIQVKTSPPNFSASPLRTQSQLQSHVQAQVMQPPLPSLPMPPQQPQQHPQQQQPQHLHLPPYQAAPQHHHHQQTQQQQQQPPTQTPSNVEHRPSQSPIPPPSIPSGATTIAPVPTSVGSSMAAVAATAAASQPPPQQPTPPTPSQQPPMMNGHGRPGGNTNTTVNNTAAATTTSTNTGANGRISPKQQQVKQEVLTLEGFVHALEQETEFDRKHYDVDITPLIHRMGQGAGFSQLGRGVCEHVLRGTKFNFSLKDQRRSIKMPDTLSTLRYYCSQRADTAKPRKASDHPKATNRYDCAGALTIIIDLHKKAAHVTLIHKHSHPPFVPHHHHHYHNNKNNNNNNNSNNSNSPASSSQQGGNPQVTAQQQQRQQQQRQQQKRLLQQRKAKQIEQQFDTLRQKVMDFGRLLENQQGFKNKDFIQTASEAFAGADEMLTACLQVDQAMAAGMNITPQSNYTKHYNKKGNV